MPTPHRPPNAVRRTLRRLGADLSEARRRRRLSMQIVADRAFTSRSTLQRVEAGDPGVGMGIYAAVMLALGFLEGLGRIADPGTDELGRTLASAALPKRIVAKRTSRPNDA